MLMSLDNFYLDRLKIGLLNLGLLQHMPHTFSRVTSKTCQKVFMTKLSLKQCFTRKAKQPKTNSAELGVEKITL